MDIKKTYLHTGIPVPAKMEGMTYMPGLKVWIGNNADYSIEYLYWEQNTPCAWRMVAETHVAYKVDDVQAAVDAAVAGDIFAAPGGEKVFEALDYVKRDAGTLLITLNHNGDRMSGSKAMRKAQKAGLKVAEIVIHDDIAQGPDTPIEDKRGLGGVIPFIKVVGAAAEEGRSLEEIVALANAFNDGIATLSVALKTATHPQNGGEIGSLADDEMEIGMGQHGEGGGGIVKMCTADETVEKMIPSLVKATKLAAGDKALLLINGSGATTTMEMLICYRKAKKMLEAMGVTVLPGKCDELLTVQEMAGFQMILCKCCDTCAKYLAAPADAPYWTTR